MKLKCFIHGHTNDEVCQNCGMHDYYDSYHADPGCRYHTSIFTCYEFTIRNMFSMIATWYRWKKDNLFRTCNDCRKPEKRFGKNCGDHSNCLPF